MPAAALTAVGINLFATAKAKQGRIPIPAFAGIASASHVTLIIALTKLAEVWLK